MISYTTANVQVSVMAETKRYAIDLDLLRQGDLLRHLEFSAPLTDSVRDITKRIESRIKDIAIAHEATENHAGDLQRELDKIKYMHEDK